MDELMFDALETFMNDAMLELDEIADLEALLTL